ncbi:hypothetical protein F5148DRAFT_896587 [Russula earlei]|uniref:Uncharacterized protein n=1 Tax=Russula earlei TaxID=71964 RepID=A0ACC0TRN8_9AGAM|nr:hypothetical protein F5148DRAFT_896587 [Russula earlei]
MFDAVLESGIIAFHFFVRADAERPLNYSHEYQAVWIEPSDGTHIFDLQIGTAFNTTLSSADTHVFFRVRAHDGTVLLHITLLLSSTGIRSPSKCSTRGVRSHLKPQQKSWRTRAPRVVEQGKENSIRFTQAPFYLPI